MPVNLNLSLRYITSYTPLYSTQKQVNNFLKKKIFCKNFFFFILIFEFLNKKLTNKVTFSFFCTQLKKKSLTYLRSPNRSKSSQVTLTLTRYNILLKLKIKLLLNSSSIQNPYTIIYLIHFFFRKFSFFESNILTLNSTQITINYILRKYV